MNTQKIIITTFLGIFIIAVFSAWYLFYPRKIVEKNKKNIEFQVIYNPFKDNQDYYQVIKYLYSKQTWIIGWGGGSSSFSPFYGYGLADANKNILISPEYSSQFTFKKAFGYTTSGILDTINLIQVDQLIENIQKTKRVNPNGTLFKDKGLFKNNMVILAEARYPISGSLYNIKEDIYIGKQQNMWWIDTNTILVKSYVYKNNSKEYDSFYGALSIKGDTIVHVNKTSKEEVLDLINNTNNGINSLIK